MSILEEMFSDFDFPGTFFYFIIPHRNYFRNYFYQIVTFSCTLQEQNSNCFKRQSSCMQRGLFMNVYTTVQWHPATKVQISRYTYPHTSPFNLLGLPNKAEGPMSAERTVRFTEHLEFRRPGRLRKLVLDKYDLQTEEHLW